MTPNEIAQRYLPKFWDIGQAMNGVEHSKNNKDAFTAVLIAALTEAFAENAKLAEAVAPLTPEGTKNETTAVIAQAIRTEGNVSLVTPPPPLELPLETQPVAPQR